MRSRLFALRPPNDGPARPLFQTEGLIYMSYVQAAVTDAVTKIAGRCVPYHDFNADTAGVSPQAAIIAATYNTLVAKSITLAALPDAGKAQGNALG